MLHGAAMRFTCCRGPSVPVKHPGRKKRAPWPTRQTSARGEKSAIPVGMTITEKAEYELR